MSCLRGLPAIACALEIAGCVVPLPDVDEACASATDYASVVICDEPVAYFKLDEGAPPNARDSSSSALQARYVDDATLGRPGIDGTGARFAGHGLLTPGDVPALDFAGNAPFTLEAWVRREDYTPVCCEGMISKGAPDMAGYALMLDADGKTFFQRRGEDGAATDLQFGPVLPLDTFAHLAVTYDGSTMRTYLDGAEEAVGGSAVVLPARPGLDFGIGAMGTRDQGTVATWYAAPVVIDEVAVYDRSLDATRIGAHHQAGAARVVAVEQPSCSCSGVGPDGAMHTVDTCGAQLCGPAPDFYYQQCLPGSSELVPSASRCSCACEGFDGAGTPVTTNDCGDTCIDSTTYQCRPDSAELVPTGEPCR